GWREWRGSLRDGIVSGVDLTADLPSGTWPEAWRVRTGEGLSGLVVDRGRVYCHSRLGLEEVVTCHDAASGSVLWSRSSPLETDFDQPFFASRITNGPLSTPTISDGRIYTVGVLGRVQCLDPIDGRLLFSVTAEDLDGAPSEPMYGHAASPLVHEGRLHVSYSTGKGPQFLALDARTGKLLWRALDEEVTYTSPIFTVIHSVPQIVVRSWTRLAGLDPATGRVLWEHAAVTGGFTRDCATPVIAGDVIFFTNEFHGTIAVKVTREGDAWSAARLWRSGYLSGSTATPILHQGYLYGLHKKGKLTCIDGLTGERRWVARDFGSHVSIISFGDRGLILDDAGKLALVKFSPDRYEPIASWTVGEYTWAHPAIDEERLYFRDGPDLVALRLAHGAGAPGE
ncbi:MAG TPA: PQQ-binding-like beta-propeller repeat protein, partial [Planctomycetota bacterium]|nr:PQQ-binding-like beta-propeller repeat protein [Planctomycetota bacterium]